MTDVDASLPIDHQIRPGRNRPLAPESSNRWIAAATLALLSFVLMPVTVIVHELTHFTVALAFGLPAEMHPGSTSGGAELGHSPGWMVALQTGAAPAVSLLIGLGCASIYARDPRRLWALAIAADAVSRFVMDIAYVGARLLFLIEGRPYSAQPVFDEHEFAESLGLAPLLVTSVATLGLLGLVWWLVRRTERRRRLPFAVAAIAGILAGTSLWFALAPPVLLSVGGR
jgi:hypothetical protein